MCSEAYSGGGGHWDSAPPGTVKSKGFSGPNGCWAHPWQRKINLTPPTGQISKYASECAALIPDVHIVHCTLYNVQMYNVQCTMYNGMTSNDVFSIMSIYCPIYVNSYIYVVTYRVSHETWQLVNSLKCLLP